MAFILHYVPKIATLLFLEQLSQKRTDFNIEAFLR